MSKMNDNSNNNKKPQAKPSSFKSILKTNPSHESNQQQQQQQHKRNKTESILLNEIESTTNCIVVDETTIGSVTIPPSPSPVEAGVGGGGGGLGGRAIGSTKPGKKRSVETSSSSGGVGGGGGRASKVDSQANCNEYTASSASVEYRPSKTDNIYRFYITRLKHSLIISFLLLIPVQNASLCIISQFVEQVFFCSFKFNFFKKKIEKQIWN